MKKKSLRLSSAVAMSTIGMSAAMADSVPNDIDMNSLIEINGVFFRPIAPDCGDVIGAFNQEGGNFILVKDVQCESGELVAPGQPILDNQDTLASDIPPYDRPRPTPSNAALTILGDNTTLLLNGHVIDCNGDKLNDSSEGTNLISSIGVWMNDSNGYLSGRGEDFIPVKPPYDLPDIPDRKIGRILNCNIGVEVGAAFTPVPAESNADNEVFPPEYFPPDYFPIRRGGNIIESLDIDICNAGIRVLNSNNSILFNEVLCDSRVEIGGSSDGFLLGLGIGGYGVEKAPVPRVMTLFNNTFFGNLSIDNVYGFVSTSQLPGSGQEKLAIFNTFSFNKATHGDEVGFLIAGTGNIVEDNVSTYNATGILVTTNEANKDDIIFPIGLNNIEDNIVLFNTINGIVAEEFTFGNVFLENVAFCNGSDDCFSEQTQNDESISTLRFDLFDGNGACAFTVLGLGDLNLWRHNRAPIRNVFPLCTLSPFDFYDFSQELINQYKM